MQINHHSMTNMAAPIATKMAAWARAMELVERAGGLASFVACSSRPAAEGDVQGVPWADMPGVSEVSCLGVPNLLLVPFTLIPLLEGILHAKAFLCKYVMSLWVNPKPNECHIWAT